MTCLAWISIEIDQLSLRWIGQGKPKRNPGLACYQYKMKQCWAHQINRSVTRHSAQLFAARESGNQDEALGRKSWCRERKGRHHIWNNLKSNVRANILGLQFSLHTFFFLQVDAVSEKKWFCLVGYSVALTILVLATVVAGAVLYTHYAGKLDMNALPVRLMQCRTLKWIFRIIYNTIQ